MQTTASAMPAISDADVPPCTSMNIGYGDSIASSAASFRKRAPPMRSAIHAAIGCAMNWMIATANRLSRISERETPTYCVVYAIMNVFVK